jgi:parallel beta-helix repeat protein
MVILSTLGENFFNVNGDSGIYVINAENITLSKVTVNDNNNLGIYVGSAATLSISSGNIFRNGKEGIDANLSGNVSINSLMVINNGTPGLDYDGINISTSPASLVNILGSIITGHIGSGIDLTGASALILDGTFYYGNDTDNDGQPNVDWP